MKPKNKKFVLLSLAIIIFLIIWNLPQSNCPQIKGFSCPLSYFKKSSVTKLSSTVQQTAKIFIGNKVILAQVANTPARREQGLSGLDNLASGTGMLFIFEQPGIYTFWMKDMKFPIDIIWINGQQEIVDLTSDLQPETFPNTVSPQKPALYILEVPAGFIKDANLKIGDKISVNLPS